MLNKKFFVVALVFLLWLWLPLDAKSAAWVEVGDAGQLPDSAQGIIGVKPLTEITGSINNVNDIDMYKLMITDPVNFTASTVGGVGFDTALWLFDSGGSAVIADDDVERLSGDPLLQSTLSKGSVFQPTDPGVYYLAITPYYNVARSLSGMYVFVDSKLASDFNLVHGPMYPPFDPVISYWESDGEQSGAYTIYINGVSPVPDDDFDIDGDQDVDGYDLAAFLTSITDLAGFAAVYGSQEGGVLLVKDDAFIKSRKLKIRL